MRNVFMFSLYIVKGWKGFKKNAMLLQDIPVVPREGQINQTNTRIE